MVTGRVQGGLWFFTGLPISFGHLLALLTVSVLASLMTEPSVALAVVGVAVVITRLFIDELKALGELTEEVGIEVAKLPGTEKGSDKNVDVYGLERGGGGNNSLSNLVDK